MPPGEEIGYRLFYFPAASWAEWPAAPTLFSASAECEANAVPLERFFSQGSPVVPSVATQSAGLWMELS